MVQLFIQLSSLQLLVSSHMQEELQIGQEHLLFPVHAGKDLRVMHHCFYIKEWCQFLDGMHTA